jgi:hypothetical protein
MPDDVVIDQTAKLPNAGDKALALQNEAKTAGKPVDKPPVVDENASKAERQAALMRDAKNRKDAADRKAAQAKATELDRLTALRDKDPIAFLSEIGLDPHKLSLDILEGKGVKKPEPKPDERLTKLEQELANERKEREALKTELSRRDIAKAEQDLRNSIKAHAESDKAKYKAITDDSDVEEVLQLTYKFIRANPIETEEELKEVWQLALDQVATDNFEAKKKQFEKLKGLFGDDKKPEANATAVEAANQTAAAKTEEATGDDEDQKIFGVKLTPELLLERPWLARRKRKPIKDITARVLGGPADQNLRAVASNRR